MAKPKPPAITSALPHVNRISAPLGAQPPRRPRSAKGRPLILGMLLRPGFSRSLQVALEPERANLVEMGVTSEAGLRKAIIKGYRLLDKSRVTAADWVGRVFEIIAPDLRSMKYLEPVVVGLLVGLVNNHIKRKLPGFHFTSGYGRSVGVTKPFGKRTVIRNVRIRRPNQQTGSDYIDRAHLAHNLDDQNLITSIEYKTRGASGDLKGQVTGRDPRLFDHDHPPGTVLVYEIEGKRGEFTMDLKDLILVTGSKSPALLREAGVFSRIGVRAGSRFDAKVAYDDVGEPYIRIIVPVATDPIRRVLERLLRDRTWQR